MKILDLCCGAGLAAIGYHEAMPGSHVVGWDIENMMNVYPFQFMQGDAFGLDYDYLSQFDLIHISPPCQRYSKVTPKHLKNSHPHLIPNALRLAYASGKSFVVENVPGSTAHLRPTFKLTLGGKVRFFHANFKVTDQSWQGSSIMSSCYSSKSDVFETWGIPARYSLTMADIRQGIPPRMTMHIAKAFMSTWKG